MLFRLTLLVASSAVLLSGVVAAIELVKLNDANTAILGLGVAKSLKTVQKGFNKDFRFGSVKMARKFVKRCKDLSASMKIASDDDFKGLAKQIKSLLAEPRVDQACKIDVSMLHKFDPLDDIEKNSYLLKEKLDEVSALGKKLERNPELKLVLSHVFEKTKGLMSRQLLAHAAKDTDLFFGDLKEKKGPLDFTTDFKHGCEIAKVKPICQFASHSYQPNMKAIGADFADLKVAIDNGDQAKLNYLAQASGVSLADLKGACLSMKRDLYPVRMLDRYVKAKMLSEQQILDRCKEHPRLDFYYQLSKLCSALKQGVRSEELSN